MAETVPIITPKPPVTLPMGGIKEKREIQKGRGVGYNEEAYRLLVSIGAIFVVLGLAAFAVSLVVTALLAYQLYFA